MGGIIEVNGRVHPKTGLENFTLSLTSVIGGSGMVNTTPRPYYPRERHPVLIV